MFKLTVTYDEQGIQTKKLYFLRILIYKSVKQPYFSKELGY